MSLIGVVFVVMVGLLAWHGLSGIWRGRMVVFRPFRLPEVLGGTEKQIIYYRGWQSRLMGTIELTMALLLFIFGFEKFNGTRLDLTPSDQILGVVIVAGTLIFIGSLMWVNAAIHAHLEQ